MADKPTSRRQTASARELAQVRAETRLAKAQADRLKAKAQVETMQRYYDAVSTSRYRPARGGSYSADAAMQAVQAKPLQFARWLDENHDLAIGILDDLVCNIIGTGVGVEPMALRMDGTPLAELNDKLRGLWREFWMRPEVTGEIPGPELERLMCRTWLRDGEVFSKDVIARPLLQYPSRIRYLIQPMESDWVPWVTDTKKGIVQGIQKDTWGRPIVYYTYKKHPGDKNYVVGLTNYGMSLEDTVPVPREFMRHLKFARRLHQTRGITILHGVLTRLDDVKDYEESERIVARAAAAIGLYIEQSADMVDTEATSTGRADFAMEPGMVFFGGPGQKPTLIDPSRPNAELSNFRASQMRAVAAGTSTRYSAVDRNYNGTYSAQRQELVEGSVHYRRLFNYMAMQWYTHVWSQFVDVCILDGILRVPRGVMPQSLYSPELRPPSLPWIQPLDEINAMKAAMEINVKSRHQVIRDLGGDPRTVDAQITADPLMKASPAGQQPPDDAPEQEADQGDDQMPQQEDVA